MGVANKTTTDSWLTLSMTENILLTRFSGVFSSSGNVTVSPCRGGRRGGGGGQRQIIMNYKKKNDLETDTHKNSESIKQSRRWGDRVQERV